MKKYDWTSQRVQELKQLYPNMKSADVAKYFGFSIYAINNKAYSLGLKKSKEFLNSRQSGRLMKGDTISEGKRYQLKKGQVPPNKGKKQKEYMSKEAIQRTKATRFQKGHIPTNAVPIGHERIDADGYIYVKVEGKRMLVLKHRHVWEQHNGVIPKGHNIQFKDGDRHNCSIDNLYIISRKEQMKNENSASKNLPDGIIANWIAGERGKNKELMEEIKANHPQLIELKRQQILLNREIKEQDESNR